jgi:SagB-type dehydrogenase family enzyme
MIRARAFLQAEKYREAGAEFEKAFAAGTNGKLDHYFAASAWALAGDRDAAFRNLDKAVGAGWTDLKMLESDTDLKEVRADQRWTAFAARLRSGREQRLSSLPDSHRVLKTVKLPEPARKGSVSVEAALQARRSVRRYAVTGLSLAQVSQLLWAAYGVNKPVPEVASLHGGLRTAPSAGACYPLEVYVVAGKVDDLEPGIYRYEPATHELQQILAGDKRAELCEAAASQNGVRTAPASIVYSAVYERNTQRYGDRGRERYVCMDLGHSAENVYLQCATLGLGTCAIGAFFDDDVRQVMRLPRPEEPLYIMPVGRMDGQE